MLPPSVPMRVPLIYVSGVFELLAAVAILFLPFPLRGHRALHFLLLVLLEHLRRASTSDLAAWGRPAYLLVRVPEFLIGWICGAVSNHDGLLRMQKLRSIMFC